MNMPAVASPQEAKEVKKGVLKVAPLRRRGFFSRLMPALSTLAARVIRR